MKKFLITAAAAVALASMSTAFAQDELPAPSVQITAPTYKVTPNGFDDYASYYALNNGMVVKFSQRVTTFYAQMKGEPKVQLFAVGPDTFVTTAGTRFKFRDTGETVAITDLERMPMTASLPATGTVYVATR